MAEENGNGAYPWRGWHVITRFLPMMFLGAIFVIFGVSSEAPHFHGIDYGIIFIWIGAILLIGAVVGMIFTKCPICYQTNWIYCSQEPDVVRMKDQYGSYYARDLAYPDHHEH